MNFSNDPLDKRLRQRFQQLFAREHAEADDALKQRIWNRLPPPAPRHYRPVGFLLLGVLFCVSIALYYGAAPVITASKSANSSMRLSAGQPTASPAQKIRTNLSGPSCPLAESVGTRLPEAIAYSDPKSAPLSVGSPDDPSGNSVLSAVPGSVVASSVAVRGRQGRRPIGLQANENRSVEPSGSTSLPISQLATKRNQRRVTTWSAVRANGFVRSPVSALERNDSSTNESVTDRVPLLLVPLGVVGPLSSTLSARLSRRVDFTSPVDVSAKTMSNQPVTPVDWFFSAAPFSTYQRMTIVAKTDTYVQEVGSPAPWSSQTWGYQLSGGIRWSGWDVALSYGQLRRWAYYERATEAYQVEPSGFSGYQVRRRTESVAENVSLSLLGVGIARSYEWGKHQRYFARAGAQLSYVLATHQGLGWLEASWGLSLPLGKRHQLEVGPRLSYSLSDVWSTDGQLRIQPYTAGLSLTIRP
ncbi:hypothetical protein [Spirosoma knui]